MGTWIRRRRTKYVFDHEVESMEHILEGVLASGHPEPMKRQLIDRICLKGRDQQPDSDVQAVLHLAIQWVLNGTSELQVSSGFKLFKSWAQHHLAALEMVLTRDLLLTLVTKVSRNHANVPLLLTEALTLLKGQEENSKVYLQHLKVLGAKAGVFLQDSPDVVSARNYVHMLLHFKDSLPKGDLAERVALPLMKVLATHQLPSEERLVYRFMADVHALTETLQRVWKEASMTTLLNCLQELFNIISNTAEQQPPSIALAALVRLIPTEIVKSAINAVIVNSRVSDAALTAALRRMIDWLAWPTCKTIDQWIIGFLNQLAGAKKFSILITVTESKVEQVLDKLQYPPVREASFNILNHMLLSFQHSPQPFHKILPAVPSMLCLLEKEETEEGQLYHTKLAELLHCLIYLHTGFPDLYDPVLDLIKDVPCPSTDEINSWLSERRWSAQQCRSSQSLQLSQSVVKSETGKTGLFNLGNTCYMNSMLQSLFMCDDFRQQTLQRVPSPEEGLLDRLQYVFASLLHSQRPAIAPMKFLNESRPPWFTPGQQQDCSEFLKFLLDQLHEQELRARKKRGSAKQGKAKGKQHHHQHHHPKEGEEEKADTGGEKVEGAAAAPLDCDEEGSEGTSVREWFGGKMRLTSRCLSCQQESNRVEDFTDILLPIPQQGDDNPSPSPPSLKALIGGGSHLPDSRVTRPPESPAGLTKSSTEIDPHSSTTELNLPSTTTTDNNLPNNQTASTTSATAPQTTTSPAATSTMHLSELVNRYLSAERLEGDNQYHCERCGQLQDGERVIGIVRPPRYLILTLVRFKYDAGTQTRSKIFREVTCPRTLALPVQKNNKDNHHEYPASEGATDPISTATKRRKRLLDHLHSKLPPSVSSTPENCELYGLCSVVVHSGASSDCGHYYCFSRHSQTQNVDDVISSLDKTSTAAANSCSGDNSGAVRADAHSMEVDAGVEQATGEETDIDFLQERWCLFNDARVSAMNFSSFKNLAKRFQKDTPYVLVYRRLELDRPEEEGNRLAGDPPLRQSLRDAVTKDNSQFLKEQELAAKAKAKRQQASPTPTFTHWRDFDSDQGGPPGSCGGGGGGGLDTSGSRFVF